MTLDLKDHVKKLIDAPGLSGYEGPVRDILHEAWAPLSDEIQESRLGSLIAVKRGEGPSPRPKVMIATHMDAIGLMVTAIEEGFLRFTQVGGVDPRILPGQRVLVHATKAGTGKERVLPGQVVMPPQHLLPKEAGSGPLGLPYLLVDTGLRPAEVDKLVQVGDLISFGQTPMELSGETIAGHTLDNRASVAALTVCLDLLQRRRHQWDVLADATVQEETQLLGGFVDPVLLKPDFAIVVDVTFATGPGGSGYLKLDLGKAVPITLGSCDHPALVKAMEAAADNHEIAWVRDLGPSGSGTDAYGIQIAESGIPVVELGIPLRYMHTPVELVSLKDIRRAGRLMAEFITDLPLDFMSTVKWE